MKKLSILLCCGAGMSSGFLAQQTRKAAKKRGFDAKIEAKSESEVSQYLSKIDILMVGPHLTSYLKVLQDQCKPYDVPVVQIPKDIYATLDGGRLLDLVTTTLKLEGEKDE